MIDDLSVFAPEPVRVRAGGRDFDILPLKIGKLAAFTKALSSCGGYLLQGDFASAFVHHYNDLRAGVAIGAGVDEAWLDDLDADAFVILGVAVVRANMDFFVARLMPAMAAAAQAMGRPKAAPAGAASSRP